MKRPTCCNHNCRQSRDCPLRATQPASRGLPVLIMLCFTAPLVVLALAGCANSESERAGNVECEPTQEIDRSAKRERAIGLAAAGSGRAA